MFKVLGLVEVAGEVIRVNTSVETEEKAVDMLASMFSGRIVDSNNIIIAKLVKFA